MYSYNISQNQVSPSFGADIRRTVYIEAGLKRANELLKEGTEAGIERVNRFFNDLNYIRNDKSMGKFSIDAYPEDIHHEVYPGLHWVKVDSNYGTSYTIEHFRSDDFGDYCMRAVREFIKRHYGEDIAEKIAQTRHPALKKMDDAKISYEHAQMQAAKKMSNSLKSFDFVA